MLTRRADPGPGHLKRRRNRHRPGLRRARVFPPDRIHTRLGGVQHAEQRHLRFRRRPGMHRPRWRFEQSRLRRSRGRSVPPGQFQQTQQPGILRPQPRQLLIRRRLRRTVGECLTHADHRTAQWSCTIPPPRHRPSSLEMLAFRRLPFVQSDRGRVPRRMSPGCWAMVVRATNSVPVPLENRTLGRELRDLGCQAARSCSLIRPLRTGFRRIWRMRKSAVMTRGRLAGALGRG